MIHGILHLCGFNDKSEDEKKNYETKRKFLFKLFVSRETITMFTKYDLIVVGAGHAGCEAAAAAASLGSRVLVITMNMQTIAQMSCNPAMGGIAKGQILREIDALGGMSGIVSDESMIQFRMLNKSKGPAMWSPRTQNDRALFPYKWRMCLEANCNIDFYQDSVVNILIESNKVKGVVTSLGNTIYSNFSRFN